MSAGKFSLVSSGKSEVDEALIPIAVNNGTLLGVYLYLRSISAAAPGRRPWFSTGLVSIACLAALAWLAKHDWPWLE
jgi:hypothetical protein